MVYPLMSVHPSALRFWITPPTVFIEIALKLEVQLNHEAIQYILFGCYSTPNFDGVVMFFFNDFSDLTFVSR